MSLKDECIFVQTKPLEPITPEYFFSSLRKEMHGIIDTPENRKAIQHRIKEFKKNWRTLHPIVPKIKEVRITISIDANETD